MRAFAYVPIAVATAAVLVFGTPAALSTSSGPGGSLALNIADIPGETPANVLILGPGEFRANVKDTSVLEDLRPGTYTAYATAGESSWGTWLARPASSEVIVGSGQHASMTFAFTLKPTADPLPGRGDPNSFSFVAGPLDDPVRWNPCRTITWAPVAPLPDGEKPRLESAFAKVSRATGIAFAEAPPGQPADLSVNLTMVPGYRVDGEGIMEYIPPYGNIKGRAIAGRIEGQIGTETPGELREALYLHEIGHVVGLAHSSDPSQVMYEVVDPEDGLGFGAGDLTGLRRLGTEAGCLNPPPEVQSLNAERDNDTLTLRWFQPSADPAVQESRVRVVRAGVEGGAETSLTWLGSVPAAAGLLSGSVTLPANACDPGQSVELVASNAYGDTVTPLNIPGCGNSAAAG